MDCVSRELSRRGFLEMAGGASLAASIAGWATAAREAEAPDPVVRSDRRIRIGVVGGGFGSSFHWHEDPNCIVQAVSDLRADRREHLMKTYRCGTSYESLEKLILDKSIDAVAVFTGAPDHARHCRLVMEAGKHCICAVPVALTLEDCAMLKEVKERQKVTYMMAETSYYRHHTIAARKLFGDGAFGELFYSEVEYYHPSSGKERESLAFYQGKRTWRYGYPPMLYPTHSTGFLIGVTRERLVEVSCLGWGDRSDRHYNGDNAYKNPFNAQSALCKTDKGHMCRCNVFWGGTAHGERAQWFGTKLTFYMPGSGGQPFALRGPGAPRWDRLPDFWHMVPRAMRRDSGHGGSHPFLTHEFIAALCENREPAVNIYEALAMTAPGIVAHASAFRGGEQMKVPSYDPA
jgi:predicted dehydrogenase